MSLVGHLRAQLEQAFKPLACDCTLVGETSITVRVYDPDSGRVDLVVSGLNLQHLRTTERVAALIEELRYELQSNRLGESATALRAGDL